MDIKKIIIIETNKLFYSDLSLSLLYGFEDILKDHLLCVYRGNFEERENS